jgi:hypothetical protein
MRYDVYGNIDHPTVTGDGRVATGKSKVQGEESLLVRLHQIMCVVLLVLSSLFLLATRDALHFDMNIL